MDKAALGQTGGCKYIVWAIEVLLVMSLLSLIFNILTTEHESLYDPTTVVTFYYRSSSPSTQLVLPIWDTFIRNAKSDGKFITRLIDCDDPDAHPSCKSIDDAPVLIKRQASGNERKFNGSHTAANYYHFANMDY